MMIFRNIYFGEGRDFLKVSFYPDLISEMLSFQYVLLEIIVRMFSKLVSTSNEQ